MPSAEPVVVSSGAYGLHRLLLGRLLSCRYRYADRIHHSCRTYVTQPSPAAKDELRRHLMSSYRSCPRRRCPRDWPTQCLTICSISVIVIGCFVRLRTNPAYRSVRTFVPCGKVMCWRL